MKTVGNPAEYKKQKRAESPIHPRIGYFLAVSSLAFLLLFRLAFAGVLVWLGWSFQGVYTWLFIGVHVAPTVISAVGLWGFWKKSRFAWIWGWELGIFVGLILGYYFYVLLEIGLTNTPGQALYVGTHIVALATMVMALLSNSARRDFGLICPKCDSPTKRSADFFFRQARCTECFYQW